MAQQCLACKFEHRDGNLARETRELLKELTERVPSFDVVDCRTHRHERPGEARLTTEAVGRNGTERGRLGHQRRRRRVA